MRKHAHWIRSFVEYASYAEAPLQMYFWTGVSVLAGALRRQVWIDMGYFRWLSNFYIILVAPPGVVAKSSSASIGMELLRQVPGIAFGPDVVTWQALVQSLAQSGELIEIGGKMHPQAALTIEASELGNLLNPQDREMVDLLVTLWDGKKQFDKVTKMSGSDSIQGVWVNIIACTTPDWIAGNFPEYMLGGGFMSRCIFVYADKKRQLVAYPKRHLPPDFAQRRQTLIDDLTHISRIKGQYELHPEGIEWGEAWYERVWTQRPPHLDNQRFSNYLARKQTHLHKVAMVLAASQRDELVIVRSDLMQADELLSSLEKSMPKILGKVGMTDAARTTEHILEILSKKKVMEYSDLLRESLKLSRDPRMLEQAIESAAKAGLIKMQPAGNQMFVKWVRGID